MLPHDLVPLTYACAGSRTGRGPTTCLSLGGVTIEQAVTAQVLEAIQPVGIEAALAAGDQLARSTARIRMSSSAL